MSLFDPVDLYCERLTHGFWEEPLNAITNLSFIIAAWLLYRLQQNTPMDDSLRRQNLLLFALVALVGVGSFVFHTSATVLGLICDVAGIMIFVHTYLYICLRRLIGWSRIKSLLVIVAFFTLLMAAEKIPTAYSFNGSAAYFPCVLIIGWMWLKTHTQAYSKYFLYAAATLIVSLILRTIDIAACEIFPIGTHIFWHLLNGIVLYLLARVLIQPAKAAN